MNRKEEKLLREYVRREFVFPAKKKIDEEMRNENKARLWIRSMISEAILEKEFTVINEAKDSAKPHPKTSINFLRDSFRKLLPNLEKDYKMLTTSAEQRESFRNHYLSAIVRMYDQADGLSASVDAEDYSDLGAEPVLKDPDASNDDADASLNDTDVDGLSDTPADDDAGLDDLMKDISTLEEGNDDLDATLEEADIDVVSDLKPEEKETKGFENDINKEISKKSEINVDRNKFANGVDGDVTGRNKAYDSFKNNHNYLLSNYSDLAQIEDIEDFKKWSVYNLKLSFDGFEQDLQNSPDVPEIANPEQQV
tara:strand:+ start:4417 stop:5346 length:930 start_codon:yes stop_codon:yes gene_type:complete